MCIGAPAHYLPVLSYLANIKFQVVGGVDAIGLDNGDGEALDSFKGQYHIGYMIIVVEEKYYVNSHSAQVLDIIEVHCRGIPRTGLIFLSQSIKTATPRIFSSLTKPDI
jgi:hypothetical protein